MPSATLLITTVTGLAAAALLLLRSLLVLVRVEGTSMAPALRNGQWVLALRHVPGRFLRRGQIALVCPAVPEPEDGPPLDRPTPGPVFLKRIRGLPGDRIETTLDDHLPPVRGHLRAGHGDDRAPGPDGPDGPHGPHAPNTRRVWNVAPGQVFVQGDGPGSDSRAWGPIPWSAVRAIVIAPLGGPR